MFIDRLTTYRNVFAFKYFDNDCVYFYFYFFFFSFLERNEELSKLVFFFFFVFVNAETESKGPVVFCTKRTTPYFFFPRDPRRANTSRR